MDNPMAVVALTLLCLLVVYIVTLLLLSGFSLSRIWIGLRTEMKALTNADFSNKVKALLEDSKPQAKEPTKPSGAPLRLLSILQREGRLIDFLLEDIKDKDQFIIQQLQFIMI